MESTNNDIRASDPLASTTMCTTRKDDNEEESELINSFFLPGGILDPEDNRAAQSHALGGGGRQIHPPQDSFYLPPVEESWSSTRPLEPPSPPQQPNNSNPLVSDILISNRAVQGYRTSDSFFGGLKQQPPGLKLPSNESEEIRWFREGSPSLQHDLALDAFQGGQSFSSLGRDPLINQTSILQSETNTYFGSPPVASAPVPINSVFSIDSGNPLMTTGIIGSQLEQGSTSSNIVMQPPPGFHAIEPTASTIPVPPKEDPPADTSFEARPPNVQGLSKQSKANSNDNFQEVNSKVRQKKESSATENSWVGTSSKARGSNNKGNLKTTSRQLSGEAHTYFEPLTVTLVESDEYTTPETEQQPVDERMEDTDTKINLSPASRDDTAQEVMQMNTIHSIENFQNKSNENFVNVSLPKKEMTGSPKKPTKTTPRSKPRGKNPTSTSRRNPEEVSTPQDPPRLNGDSNSSTGSVLEPFQGILQWGDEILFPAIKQAFSKSSVLWKTIRLFATVDYHVYSYAIQDVHTYETNDLIGLTFFQIPLISNILMRFFDAPQFTPHLVSYCILFYLCRPRKLVSAGSAECGSPSSMFGPTAKRRKDRVAADFGHYLCQTTLRCIQISLPFVFIFEGFERPQTAIMRLTQCERIVVFYFLRSLRESIILSPIIWVTLLLQAILARLSNPSGFWLELMVIQCSLAIGMASVSFVRKQGEIGDGLLS